MQGSSTLSVILGNTRAICLLASETYDSGVTENACPCGLSDFKSITLFIYGTKNALVASILVVI